MFSRYSFITVPAILLLLGLVNSKPIDSECESNTDCTTPNAICDFETRLQCKVGICRCNSTHTPVKSDVQPGEKTCFPLPSEIGDECEHDKQCQSVFGQLSKCLDKSCQCEQSAVNCDNGKISTCEPTKTLGEDCLCGSQCNHVTGATCTNVYGVFSPTRCVCSNGIPLNTDQGWICAPYAEALGDTCAITDLQCHSVPNSLCDSRRKTCECNSTTHVPYRDLLSKEISCEPLQDQLHWPCRTDAQCVGDNRICGFVRVNSTYYDRCQCHKDFVESKETPGLCLKAARTIGDPCTENEQCTHLTGYSMQNAECFSNKTCQCKPGFRYDRVSYPDFGTCIPEVVIGSTCKIQQQCIDATGSRKYTNCDKGICECNAIYNGVCYFPAEIGGPCTSIEECRASISGSVICDETSFTCRCDEGYKAEGNARQCAIA